MRAGKWKVLLRTKGDLRTKERNILVGWNENKHKTLRRKGVRQIRGTQKVLTFLEASRREWEKAGFYMKNEV